MVRRSVLLGIALLMSCALCAQQPMRMSWETFAKDPKRVESFRKAVQVMKTRSIADQSTADYRTSWAYWGNMHGYFGPQAARGTIADWIRVREIDVNVYGLYFQGVTNLLPPDDIAKAVWAQCQHGTPYFFPWHRLYLLYFEKTLQKAAGDPTLRLPYWDYTDPTHLGMPAEFVAPTYTGADGKAQPNPLYEFRRAPGWLTAPFSTLDPDLTDITQSLTIPNFLDSSPGAEDGYQRTIEVGPHAAVHCAVMDCPVPVMGAVPYSSNDPIFWMHHANVDRMWDCWASIPGHQNPGGDYLTQPFSYVDETGTLVTKTVGDIINGHMVDYVYEQASDCGRKTLTALAAAPARKPLTDRQKKNVRAALARPALLGAVNGVAIDAPVVKKSIALPPANVLNKADAQTRDLALHAQNDVPVKTELVLSGIHYDAHPAAQFKIYLERKDDPTKRVFVGALSFFTPLETPAEHDHRVTGAPPETVRVFDVTDPLRRLGVEDVQGVNVVFEAVTGRVGAEAARFNLASHLTVANVELRVRLRE